MKKLLIIIVVLVVVGGIYVFNSGTSEIQCRITENGVTTVGPCPEPNPGNFYNADDITSHGRVEQALKDRQEGTNIVFDLISPNGGEIIDKTTAIKFKIGSTLKAEIFPENKVELYLLDSKNVLVGYIGDIDAQSSGYNWDPKKLFHNAGLDMTSAPTPAGQYRILMLAREIKRPNCDGCDPGVNTLDNPYTTYENKKLVNSHGSVTDLIASDVSESSFTVK